MGDEVKRCFGKRLAGHTVWGVAPINVSIQTLEMGETVHFLSRVRVSS